MEGKGNGKGKREVGGGRRERDEGRDRKERNFREAKEREHRGGE